MGPRRKTGSTSNRQAEPPAKAPRSTNVEEWVYRFLGNLAAIETAREEAKGPGRNRSARLRLRSPSPYAWSPPRGADALQGPTRLSKAAPIHGPRPPHRDPTLLQKIHRYIRAGIAEGKRRAKRYVRKALSFALETGYLLPADREGKLLRLSPALLAAAGKASVVARSSRPRQRRGGRVRRRPAGTSNTTNARRTRRSESGFEATAGDAPNAGTAAKRKRNKSPSREQHHKSSGGSRKSTARSSTSPSRPSHQRPIEDLAPVMPRAGSSGADRKPLSARSRPSLARRSHDQDLLA